jgi:hypothetical protein
MNEYASSAHKIVVLIAILSIVVVAFLLVPVIVCNALNGEKARMAVIALATILFVTDLASLAKARTVEMFVAGTA